MKNKISQLAALILVFGSPFCLAQEDELVAIVDLRFLKETEQVVAVMCFDDDCGPSAYGYLYEATVRKVVNGHAPRNKFLVIYGRHAMRKNNVRGLAARFNKLTDNPDGAEYQIVRTAYEGQPTCFEWFGSDGSGPAEFPNEGLLLQCFGVEREGNLYGEALLREAEQTLRVANDAYNKALIAGDVDALEKIFADEFIYTSTSGQVVDKAAQLELFRSNTLDIVSGEGADEKVQIHAKTGIVVGQFNAKGTYAGKVFDARERYTSIWVVRDDRWQLVAEQGTLLGK